MVENVNNNKRILDADMRNIQTRTLISDAEGINASMRSKINGQEMDEVLEAFKGRSLKDDHDVVPRQRGGKSERVAQNIFRQMSRPFIK